MHLFVSSYSIENIVYTHNVVYIISFILILFLLVLLGKWKSWLRYPTIIVLFILGVVLLFSKILIHFDQYPDPFKFFKQNHLIFYSFDREQNDNSSLILSNPSKERVINPYIQQKQEVDIPGIIDVRYASLHNNPENFVVLVGPEGSQFFLFPQSHIVFYPDTIPGSLNYAYSLKNGMVLVWKNKENKDEPRILIYNKDEKQTINKALLTKTF
ncbi:MAG: hypothetical protein GXP45_07395 [bacterium]|nr:hypothetical protein [bacterium]